MGDMVEDSFVHMYVCMHACTYMFNCYLNCIVAKVFISCVCLQLEDLPKLFFAKLPQHGYQSATVLQSCSNNNMGTRNRKAKRSKGRL